ncbi:MAG: hypothetical protein QOG05_3770 [Streptosporangiaceae bacterium]|nr:hypothetical protein [Streptosporangiaceae bacterium]
MRDRGTGRSLTPHPGRVGLVLGPEDPAVLDRVLVLGPAPADLVLVGQGDRVELMGRVAPVVLVPPRLVGRAGPVELVLVGQGDRVGLMSLAERVVLMSPVDLADRVGLMSLVDRAAPAAPVDLAAPADLEAPDLMGRAARVDRHRRRTSNTVSTTGVARSGAAPGMHRTDSARRTTVHRLRPGNTDSDGTVDRPPEPRRLTGTGHRLLAAGTGRRLLVAGMLHGTGRLATSVWHRPISGRLPTAASMPYRSSTRCSVGGASGSSATGFRCTDLTARSPD